MSDPTYESKGMELVRLSFNPSGDQRVVDVKTRVARLIDDLEDYDCDPRERNIAITHLQTASMFAVAAITKPKKA